MSYTFTPGQILEIENLLVQGPVQGNYAHAYRYLADLLATPQADGSTPKDDPAVDQVYRWLRGAEQANAGEGVFSALIREYTQQQAELRIGGRFTVEQMQEASNAVATALLQDILDNNNQLPTIGEVAEHDARQVGDVLFSQLGSQDTAYSENSAWSGTILFSGLGSDQSSRLVKSGPNQNAVDTLDDIKNVLFAYQSMLSAGSTVLAGNFSYSDFSEFWDDTAIAADLAWDAITNPLKTYELFQNSPAAETALFIHNYGPERVFEMIRDVYTGNTSAATVVNFNSEAYAFFSNTHIDANSQQQTGIEFLNGKSVNELRTMAFESEKYRNALMSLSSIAVELNDYSGRGLSLIERDTGDGNLSTVWIRERASMLIFRQLYDTQGLDYGEALSLTSLAPDVLLIPIPGLEIPFFMAGDLHYVDMASGIELHINGFDAGIIEPTRIVFGDGGNNTVTGGNGDDRLFGGEGHDVLIGGAGDDLLDGGAGMDELQGGAGNDVYYANPGDTIVDSDGIGSIVFNDRPLTGGERDPDVHPPGVYQGRDGFTYRENGDGSVTVTDPNSGDTLDIQPPPGGGAPGQGGGGEPPPGGEPPAPGPETPRGFPGLGVPLTTDDPDEPPDPMTPAEDQPVDPLVFDLDGDGIELTAMTSGHRYFDLDADGFRERSGWISADDGILAIDANGDGVINDISELFGDASTSGFTELISYDSNNDWLIDSNDSHFSQLLMWRDLNQNGWADVAELSTLTAAGISSINLDTVFSGQIINGNLVTETGTFTWTDGTVGNVADVHLVVNQIDTIYAGNYELDLGTLALPQVRGYGELPDLHIAMSLDPALMTMVQDFNQLTSADIGQAFAQIDAILIQWAGASNIDPNSRPGQQANYDAQKLAVLEAFAGRDFMQQGLAANPSAPAIADLERGWTDVRSRFAAAFLAQGPLAELFPDAAYNMNSGALDHNADLQSVLTTLNSTSPNETIQAAQYWSHLIPVLDQLSAGFGLSNANYDLAIQNTLDQYGLGSYLTALRAPIDFSGALENSPFPIETGSLITSDNGDTAVELLNGPYIVVTAAGNDQVSIGGPIESSLIALGEGDNRVENYSGYGGSNLTIATGMGQDLFHLENGNHVIDGGSGHNTFYLADGDNQIISGSGDDLIHVGIGNNVIHAGDGMNDISVMGGQVSITAGSGNDMLNINAADGIVNLGDGSNTVSDSGMNNQLSVTTGAGIDTFNLSDGHYQINAGGGNDTLFSGTGNNSIDGGAGDDDISIWGNGQNTLAGGSGNDVITGGWGNETYVFNAGDGQDIIDESAGGLDRITFGTGISSSDITTSFDATGRIVLHVGTGSDQITLAFSSETETHVETLEFTDGSIVQLSDLLTPVNNSDHYIQDYSGTDYSVTTGSGMDTIHLGDGNHTVNSGAGNDDISVGAGDSVIDAGSGDNSVSAGYGNHTISAGDDADTVSLNGGSSILNLGNGNNMIDDYSYMANHTITTGSGMDGFYFGDGNYTIVSGAGNDYIDVGSGTSTIDAGDGADTVYVGGGISTLLGGAGDDYLYGANGADTLSGGSGTDYLAGYEGDDLYQFNRGDGSDYVYDEDWSYSGTDIAQFGPDIRHDQLWFSSDGNDLTISVIGSNDAMIIQSWEWGSEYRLETIYAGDGYALQENQVQQLVDAMAAFAPPAPGELDMSPELQAELDAVITSSWQPVTP